MPRGDGKKSGERRVRSNTGAPQVIGKSLRKRLDWYDSKDNGLNGYTVRDKTDGSGNSYRRPGSNKK